MKCGHQGGTAGSDMPGLTAFLEGLWSTSPGKLMLWRLLLQILPLLQVLLCRLLLLLWEILWLLLMLPRKILRWRLLLVKILLLRLLATFAVIFAATSIAVPTSAAIAASTSPASPSLTALRLETSDQDMVTCII